MKKQYLRRVFAVSMVAVLLLAVTSPVIGAPEKVRVFVEFARGSKAAAHNALNGAGAEFHYTFDSLNSFVVTLPVQSLPSLSRNPNILEIEEDAPRYPIAASPAKGWLAPLADTVDANGQTVPYGVDAVQARDVWDVDRNGAFDSGAPTGSGATVCIIDTGFFAAHEDFAGVNLVGGESQVDDDYTRDGYGHGTHVAGTIVGQNNSLGVIGVAPEASLYIVKFFNDSGSATFASDLIAAANTCESNGAKIISMSLGGSRQSGQERRAFDQLDQKGVLSIAAAGNDGNTAYSYPASYDSVLSVAAVDEANAVAGFSQQNDQVELAAPGVAVLSTLPYIDSTSLTVGGTTYQGNHIEFSARGDASGPLVNGGLCDSAGSWSGAVVLCERGAVSFYDKVLNVQDGGGVAAVIYNNEPGNFFGTLGDGNSAAIVALSLSQEDGQALVANNLGQAADASSQFSQPDSGYAAWNGTSMATPHVSAVAALLWSANSSATNAEIREAMTATALDLGSAGRDNTFGFGLVQAADALTFLSGGTPPTNDPPFLTIDSPADGATFASGAEITFSGSAMDNQDGNISGSISWNSSIDGSLGSGASITAFLSDETHTITATVTDSGGLTATESITVTVGNGGTGGGALDVTVTTDKDPYTKGDTALITVKVEDGGAPVEGASVDVTITTPSERIYGGSGTTGANGKVVFSYRVNPNKDGSGTYTVDASASKNGYLPGSGSTTFVVQ